MRKVNDFSRIAFFYDRLASFVFGNAIRRSQVQTFTGIRPNSKIAILGGGSGWILEELDKLGTPIEVSYVEASPEMARIARTRTVKNLNIKYYSSISQLGDDKFDNIMAFYFLDLFNKDNLKRKIKEIGDRLKFGGLLHYADFEISKGVGRYWQVPLSMIMHIFFKATVNLESNRLLDINENLINSGFRKISEKKLYSDFIACRIYCSD